MCKCVELANKKLAADNTQIENILTIGSRSMGLTVGIRTSKLDPMKRGKPKAVLASFCPFCGTKLRP